MRTFRMLLAYDGTAFHGWQVQPGQRTVQGVLEEALQQVLGGDVTRVSGAGRTDAGVHARGQVGSFCCDTRLPARAFAPLINQRLPRDVRVRAAVESDAAFHARHSARERRYTYRLIGREDLLMERYAWRVRSVPALERLDAATRVLEGEADFRAFEGAGSPSDSTVCRVRLARWRMLGAGARLDIASNRFLYHMVRKIVATAVTVSAQHDPGAAMRDVLSSADRARVEPMAPPQGLCLERVVYRDEENA